MKNYIRITGYSKEKDCCFIIDSYGKFEKAWQLSSEIVKADCDIIALSDETKFVDGNIQRIPYNENNLVLRAVAKGQATINERAVDGATQKTICVEDKMYTVVA